MYYTILYYTILLPCENKMSFAVNPIFNKTQIKITSSKKKFLRIYFCSRILNDPIVYISLI